MDAIAGENLEFKGNYMSKFEKQKQPCCICKGHKANEPFEIRDDFGVLYKTSHISNCPYCGRFLTENYS